MRLTSIDPGNTQSAVVVMDGDSIEFKGIFPNNYLRQLLILRDLRSDLLLIEKVASYGMPVGEEVFETVYWSGRFAEAWGDEPVERLTRNQIKMALCYRTQGVNDSVIRQRVIDLYGGKEAAIGKKKTPGPLYGVKADEWAALALAKAYMEMRARKGGE